ncbi:MAG: OmpH family outer membrane protein [Prevotella sp.]|nr:OmpH family outer membrane protein [Prevotella sp.]MCF0208221.1 OmpH family outer membrane protein [Bacteroidaceae bacterium]
MKKLLMIALLAAPMTVFAQKFGHVNTQAVVQSLPDFIKSNGEIESQAKIYENELKTMQDEIQKQAAAYEQAQATMSATQKEAKEKELVELQQKLQQTYQDNQQALQKMQQDKLQPILTKVQNAIKNVGKAGGYVYIMDVAAGIPYVSETLSKDVTAEVKAEINKLK